MKKKLLPCLFLMLPFMATASESAPASLSEVLNNVPTQSKPAEGSDFAFVAVQEIGLSYGMRAGLAWASEQNSKRLESHARTLDRVYSFQPFMMANGVVPPVLVETTQTYEANDDGQRVTVADVVYKIERPARFSSSAPNWRDYLIRAHRFDASDMGGWAPRDNSEREIWARAVEKGWDEGVEQAFTILEADFARLTRDIVGMALYRKLHARNMISEPVVAKAELGVTGGGDAMNLNESILEIKDRAALKKDPFGWKSSK